MPTQLRGGWAGPMPALIGGAGGGRMASPPGQAAAPLLQRAGAMTRGARIPNQGGSAGTPATEHECNLLIAHRCPEALSCARRDCTRPTKTAVVDEARRKGGYPWLEVHRAHVFHMRS